jgi:hypothetical protein
MQFFAHAEGHGEGHGAEGHAALASSERVETQDKNDKDNSTLFPFTRTGSSRLFSSPVSSSPVSDRYDDAVQHGW